MEESQAKEKQEEEKEDPWRDLGEAGRLQRKDKAHEGKNVLMPKIRFRWRGIECRY